MSPIERARVWRGGEGAFRDYRWNFLRSEQQMSTGRRISRKYPTPYNDKQPRKIQATRQSQNEPKTTFAARRLRHVWAWRCIHVNHRKPPGITISRTTRPEILKLPTERGEVLDLFYKRVLYFDVYSNSNYYTQTFARPESYGSNSPTPSLLLTQVDDYISIVAKVWLARGLDLIVKDQSNLFDL